MNRLSFTRVTYLLAIASVFSLAPAFAKDDPEAKPKNKAGAKAPSDEAAIPECLEKLKLSDEQQSKIKDIARTYDAQLDAAWKQFSDRYLETVAMEASMLAAIEDNLNEAQRKHVRDQRRKVAMGEKAAPTDKKSASGKAGKTKAPAAEDGVVVEEEIVVIGVSLSPEQEDAADKIHHNYFGHLRSLKRDIQESHKRLVALEADKLVEIEKVLSEDQLKQLQEIRQAAPVTTKTKTQTTKTE